MSDAIATAVTAAETVVNPFGAIEKWLIRIAVYLVLGLIAIGLIAGAALYVEHHFFGSSDAPKTEAAAPAVIMAPTASTPNGSVELQRQATTPTTKAINPLPKGAKLQRQESVTVQPKEQTVTLKTASGLAETGTYTPKPVTLNLDLVKLPDGTQRVTASSPDGQVTGALDVPVAPLPPDPPKNAAGLSYGLPIAGAHEEGVWVERDVWRLRFGLDLQHVASPRANTNLVMARVGWTF